MGQQLHSSCPPTRDGGLVRLCEEVIKGCMLPVFVAVSASPFWHLWSLMVLGDLLFPTEKKSF